MSGHRYTESSTDRTAGTTRPNLRYVAARYGFRRVHHVHIVVDGAATATVTGITHRYPRTTQAPLSVAAQLVAAGAPLSIEQVGSAPNGTERP